jgi:hypothetical protein
MLTVLRRAAPLIALPLSLYAMAIDLLHLPAGRLAGQTWAAVDFHTYLGAAWVGLHGGWPSIYDQHLGEMAQSMLVPLQFNQPFISPPVDALLVAPLTLVPYWVAAAIWTTVVLTAFALALGWSTSYTGVARFAAVAAAMTPWWVLLAVYVGQVAVLVAAAVVLAWRLARDDRDIASGLVLSLMALKPNTAILVPFALLVAGRPRIFAAWAAGSAVLAGVSLVAIGPDELHEYVASLSNLPRGASALTLAGAFGLSGAAALAARAVIAVAVLVAARLLGPRPGLAMAAGALGSLLISPYLHNSDLCLLVAAGWMIWHEAPLFRPAIIAMWLAAAPFVLQHEMGPKLNEWARIELALVAGILALALLHSRTHASFREIALTDTAELGRHAPA